jgi:hypothetical protein
MGRRRQDRRIESASLRAHRRRARAADVLIAGAGESPTQDSSSYTSGVEKEPTPFNVVGPPGATPVHHALGVLAQPR